MEGKLSFFFIFTSVPYSPSSQTSALDIFGGTLVKFDELIQRNKEHADLNANLGGP